MKSGLSKWISRPATLGRVVRRLGRQLGSISLPVPKTVLAPYAYLDRLPVKLRMLDTSAPSLRESTLDPRKLILEAFRPKSGAYMFSFQREDLNLSGQDQWDEVVAFLAVVSQRGLVLAILDAAGHSAQVNLDSASTEEMTTDLITSWRAGRGSTGSSDDGSDRGGDSLLMP